MSPEPTALPDGYYAVPDPDDASTVTLWQVQGGSMKARPAKARYGPQAYRKDAPGRPGDGMKFASPNECVTAFQQGVVSRHATVEVRQIFRQMGLVGADLERVVEAITADRARCVRLMLAEDYSLRRQVRSPWRAALSTFGAFVLCGLPPLLPFASMNRSRSDSNRASEPCSDQYLASEYALEPSRP